jgi:hypothetical protein
MGKGGSKRADILRGREIFLTGHCLIGWYCGSQHLVGREGWQTNGCESGSTGRQVIWRRDWEG